MPQPVDEFWNLRLERTRQALEKNNFEALVVQNLDAAAEHLWERVLPGLGRATVSWGGSTTLVQSGLCERIKGDSRFAAIDTFERNLPVEQVLERRRQALLADLFITGSNAVCEDGRLVNLDMIGNRVAAITFGPRRVAILVGRNKVCMTLEEAMARVKHYAAPVNCLRLEKKTPCAKTGLCQDCRSPDRICNHWTITEKSFPAGRITVLLINQELGF